MKKIQNPYNPYLPKETGSTSFPAYIGSPSNTPDPVSSFASLPLQFDSNRSSLSMRYAPVSRSSLSSPEIPPLRQPIITDPETQDTYLLNLDIGSFSHGFGAVYRALYTEHKSDTEIPIKSGYVTLKIIDMNESETESRHLWRQGKAGLTDTPYGKIIGSKRIFSAVTNIFSDNDELLCVVLPYMSEGSLRYILSTRPQKKLSEEFISVVLKQVLIALRDEIHVEFNQRVHNTLNAGDIFVHIDYATQEISIKLAYEASVYDSETPNQANNQYAPFMNPKHIFRWGAAPEVYGRENEGNSGPKSDIWLLGITALELVYGDLPVRNRRDFNYIVDKIRRKKKLPKSLKKMMIKRDGRFKEVMKNLVNRKKRAFSEEFEEIVLACLRENPVNRPTADQLLNAPFFTDANDRFKQFMLNGRN
ncbi:serine/threonine-protein kinase BLUS1-like [Solanum stenotomum]|uniref:serine/threonine-protein kinase BLUS1-like n=1 Tax=Solanum stenotomum TaxID=172797 RepID=UPI0020D1EE4E|nr:serine/threonine-protein kinase BLUS1-like [Solanum stenotomum]